MTIVTCHCRFCGRIFDARMYPSTKVLPRSCSRPCHNRANAMAARGLHRHVLPATLPPADRSGDVAALALSNSETPALIDAGDAAWVGPFTWFLTTDGYVATNLWNGHRFRTVLLHRMLAGLMHQPDIWTDHRNRNRLDNRRDNLRHATPEINAQNQGGWKRSRSGVRGAGRLPSGRWCARAQVRGQLQHLGVFDTCDEAAAVASQFRAVHMPGAVELSV